MNTVFPQKRIFYASPFVPAEWIIAHGFIPRFFRPTGLGSSLRPPINNVTGMCPFTRAFLNEALLSPEADAVVVTTTCDQMRKTFDLVMESAEKPLFLMNVPTTWQTPVAYEYYTKELNRLGRFLESLGGKEPAQKELIDAMEYCENGRSRITANPGLLTGNAFTKALNSFFESGLIENTFVETKKGSPIAIIGGPLTSADLGFFVTIEKNGGAVVLDGTENGERAIPAHFDKRQLRFSPLDVLSDAYFNRIQDVFKRPNSGIFTWMKEKFKEREVKGAVLVRYVFCDLWHAEVSRMRDWLNVPSIDVDLTGDGISARNETRIAAFMETLK